MESVDYGLDIDWDSELKDNDTVSKLNIFMDKFNSAIDKYVPKSKNRNIKGNTPLSKEAVLSIKRKHRMWERYMEDRSKEKYREYCKARNKVKKLTRKERKEREKQVAEYAKSNSKNMCYITMESVDHGLKVSWQTETSR
jgi:hypothetical protein